LFGEINASSCQYFPHISNVIHSEALSVPYLQVHCAKFIKYGRLRLICITVHLNL